MWPNRREGDSYPPDCRTGGSHRFGNLHFTDRLRTTYIRICRLCPAELIKRIEVIDGKLVETVLKDGR